VTGPATVSLRHLDHRSRSIHMSLSRWLSEQSDAAHEFGALNTLLLVVVLGLCILSAYLIKQNNFYYLPESAAAILVGLVVGGLARIVYPSEEELEFLTFEPELFFFLLLPPIIFEAGYTLKKKEFFANFWTITLFAVAGTIVSTVVIGFLVYLTGLLGIAAIDTSSPMEALLFGALISAVDPVATLSIMGNPKLNCDPLLYNLVFGESVLNDAVAIVLFNTFMAFYQSGEAFTASTIPSVLLTFTVISLGSVFVGVIIGLTCCYLCKHTQMKRYPEYEIAMIFLFAYGSYSFSEAIKLSGIMSLFFCGVVLSHYNNHNLSATSQVTAHTIFKCLSALSEFFVYLYMGMGFFTGRFRKWNFVFIVLSILFCLFSRLLNSFPFSSLANLWRAQQIPFPMKCAIWFAGLRGAIAFALSQNMPGESTDLYVSTTLSIVIFTTIVCGGMTEPMLSRMGMRLDPQDDDGHGSEAYEVRAAFSISLLSLSSPPPSPLQHLQSLEAPLSHSDHGPKVQLKNLSPGKTPSAESQDDEELGGGQRAFWSQFDSSFMQPFFGGETVRRFALSRSLPLSLCCDCRKRSASTQLTTGPSPPPRCHRGPRGESTRATSLQAPPRR
jgi:solute carrier family 9 (sodium/hydrogen exchanger), member 8